MYLEPDHIFYPFYTLLISKSRIVDDLGVGFCLFSLISEPYQCITYWSLRHPIPCIAQPIPQSLGGVAILSSWKPLIAASHRSSPWKAKWTEDTKQGYITKAWLLLRQKYMNLFPDPSTAILSVTGFSTHIFYCQPGCIPTGPDANLFL